MKNYLYSMFRLIVCFASCVLLAMIIPFVAFAFTLLHLLSMLGLPDRMIEPVVDGMSNFLHFMFAYVTGDY